MYLEVKIYEIVMLTDSAKHLKITHGNYSLKEIWYCQFDNTRC